MTHIDAFTIRQVATSGCEILDSDGTVIAWAATEALALVIAGLLYRVEKRGLWRLSRDDAEGEAASHNSAWLLDESAVGSDTQVRSNLEIDHNIRK